MSCWASSIYLSLPTLNDRQSSISMWALGRRTVRKVSSASSLCRIAISLELRPHPGQRRNLSRTSLLKTIPNIGILNFRFDSAQRSVLENDPFLFDPNLGCLKDLIAELWFRFVNFPLDSLSSLRIGQWYCWLNSGTSRRLNGGDTDV